MNKHLVLSFIAAGAVMAALGSAIAQTGKAPCASFQKLPEGKWKVISPVKIEHASTSVMLSTGMTIGPGTKAAGVDIYAALQKSCP
jgi:hypothetical protein